MQIKDIQRLPWKFIGKDKSIYNRFSHLWKFFKTYNSKSLIKVIYYRKIKDKYSCTCQLRKEILSSGKINFYLAYTHNDQNSKVINAIKHARELGIKNRMILSNI